MIKMQEACVMARQLKKTVLSREIASTLSQDERENLWYVLKRLLQEMTTLGGRDFSCHQSLINH